MYMLTSLGQPQAKGDCSGWERDPASFSRVVAKHHLRTEMGLPLDVKGMTRLSRTFWRIDFPNNIAVFVTCARMPDFVAAARWEPKPAGPARFYTYSCTREGDLVLRERQRP